MFEDAGQYFMVVKDETKDPVRKNLHLVEGDSPTGRWGKAGEAFTGSWVEGPSPVKIGEWWVVYFDHYTNPKYYGAMRSKDLKVGRT